MSWMYDMTADFQRFYDLHVRLGDTRRQNLAEKRDLNLKRLNEGLDDLGKPHYSSSRNQGGYAMHTLNQPHPHGADDYDIDVAVIFRKEDLPEAPLLARQRVRDALQKRCGQFADVPEARTNAVTIWYAEGYHIDFAVYRTYTDAAGRTVMEHASTEWKERSPSAVTDWYLDQVTKLSPVASGSVPYASSVQEGQFRRVTRWTKYYCRSRSGWSLPGGMIVSALLAEGCYRADAERDDRALYDTLVALKNRLSYSTKVYSPIDGSDLTAKTEVENQVKRLHTYLTTHLPKLDILFDQSACTRQKARSAWNWIFKHAFWSDEEKQASNTLAESRALALPFTVAIRCELSRKEGERPYGLYPSASSLLRKGIGLYFSIEATNVPQPYEVKWTVTNEGDEATSAEQKEWSKAGPTVSTSTAFKGRQRMTCKVMRNGTVLAQQDHIVRIGRSLFRR